MKYDSTHGRFKHEVKIGAADELIVNGHKIKCVQASRDGPKALPWKELGVDYVTSPLVSSWNLRRPRDTLRRVPRR